MGHVQRIMIKMLTEAASQPSNIYEILKENYVQLRALYLGKY